MTASVPCGSCHLCCRKWFVHLEDDEYQKFFWAYRRNPKTEVIDRVLLQKPGGDCIYLSESGCSIHGSAPKACQSFDCRDVWKNSDRGGRRAAIKEGRMPKAIFQRGRELSELA